MATCAQIWSKTTSEKEPGSIDCRPVLDGSTETVSGITSVSKISGTGSPTISGETINTGAKTILNDSVPASQSISFALAAGTAAGRYTLRASITTSAANTRYINLDIDVTADTA